MYNNLSEGGALLDTVVGQKSVPFLLVYSFITLKDKGRGGGGGGGKIATPPPQTKFIYKSLQMEHTCILESLQ